MAGRTLIGISSGSIEDEDVLCEFAGAEDLFFIVRLKHRKDGDTMYLFEFTVISKAMILYKFDFPFELGFPSLLTSSHPKYLFYTDEQWQGESKIRNIGLGITELTVSKALMSHVDEHTPFLCGMDFQKLFMLSR